MGHQEDLPFESPDNEAKFSKLVRSFRKVVTDAEREGLWAEEISVGLKMQAGKIVLITDPAGIQHK